MFPNKIMRTLINGADFKVFDEAETVLAIAVPGCSEYSRKQTDELIEWVKRPQIGMKGLAFIKVNADGTYKSSFDKFYSEDKLRAIADSCRCAKRRPGVAACRCRRAHTQSHERTAP